MRINMRKRSLTNKVQLMVETYMNLQLTKETVFQKMIRPFTIPGH